MRDNGERIYAGLMEREDMLALEEENRPPKEAIFRWETDKRRLFHLIDGLLINDKEEIDRKA